MATPTRGIGTVKFWKPGQFITNAPLKIMLHRNHGSASIGKLTSIRAPILCHTVSHLPPQQSCGVDALNLYYR